MRDKKIETKSGAVTGSQNEDVIQYLGIPYATPPVGAGRFKRAEPVEKWEGTLSCDHFMNKAVQPVAGQITIDNDIPQDEDCLYLNIWTSSQRTEKISGKKPVLVWIHGGAFTFGEASTIMYDGGNFVRNGDLIFVSIQYRLGIFGFTDFSYLNNDELTFDTNIGLSDQITALKWINENIEFFGGNSENICLMGESAGASSVLALMASPYSKKLFHKAISQSGVCSSVLESKMANLWAEKAMEYLGLEKNDGKGLMHIRPDQASDASMKMLSTFTDIAPGAWSSGFIVDGDILPMTVIEAFKSGNVLDIPLLIGTNKDEAALFVRENSPWFPSTREQVNHMFDLNTNLNKEVILTNYPGYPDLPSLKEMGRDMCFTCDNTIIMDSYSKNNDTYAYRFDYETIVTKKLGIGSFHGMEIMFAFNNLECELTSILAHETTGPTIVSKNMHSYWINFVRNSNPNDNKSFNWQKYDSILRPVLSINQEMKILQDPHKKAYDIWNDKTLYGLKR